MTFDNDAKACYDRVVMNLALLASQRLGMPSNVCQWYTQVLQQASYYIQLPLITSDECYSNAPDNPLHGPGQGSRAAPSIWVIVSSIIMHCMKQKSRGIQFMAPDNSSQFTHIMTGFVDDTTHWLNNFCAALQGNYSKFEMYQTT